MTEEFEKHRGRIAVTGIGLVTPLGLTREETWEGILAGRRSVKWLEPFGSGQTIGQRAEKQRESSTQSKNSATQKKEPLLFGGRVPMKTPRDGRLLAFARRATEEAIQQAGLSQFDFREAGCVIGTSKSDLSQVDRWLWADGGSEDSRAFESLFPSCAATTIARERGIQAAAICPVAACATGLVSLMRGAELIRSGQCRVAIAGSADASLHPGLLASYRRLGVLAHPGDNPGTACRPFDRDKSGFAVGEGAGVFVLEDWEHARNRAAPIFAEWIDGVLGSDPAGITSIDVTGSTLANNIQRLLQRCHVSPDEIQAVSLHGTATQLNDHAETAGLRQIFGEKVDQPLAFGLKGAIGHLMGAAGAVETAACVLSLRHQRIPPTVNHDVSDAAGIPNLRNVAVDHELESCLKISLGFGGTVAIALLKATQEHRH